jgi:alpha-methylacyl-CoA racemase
VSVVAGPLSGIKIVELAGIGPGPFSGMLLSDLGADVIRVDRAQQVNPANFDKPNLEPMYRGRRSIGVDLKHSDGVEAVLRLVEQADALIEGYRPGVTERLGLGPEVCLARNPRLVYGRMTGWGQDGPLAHAAGHDINYIALAGALAHFGRAGGKPTPPINLIGDFGGGGMFMALGVVAGVLEARTSGRGQVIDVAMVDGAAILMTMMWGLRQIGFWDEALGVNVLDTGAPFYDTYETADGKFISLGSLEPQFYAELVQRLGLTDDDLPVQMDRGGWGTLREKFSALFETKTRDEWDAILRGSDACYAPVLTMSEALDDEHLRARATFIEREGVPQPAPAPRFSRTAPEVQRDAPWPGQHTEEALTDWGFSADDVTKLRAAGALA